MNRTKGYVYILLSAVCFALGGVLIKLNTWSSVSINGARSIFALMVMALNMKLVGHSFKWNKSVLFGALANTGMTLTFVMANKLTSAANAIVLQFTMPVYLIIMLWVFWKKKPDRMSVITSLVSFVGVMFFFFDQLSTEGMLGNIIALISGVLYAVVFLIKKIPNSDFESSAIVSFALNLVIAIPFLVQETEFTPMNFWTVFLLGAAQIGLAYVFLGKGLDTVSPVGASLLSMVEPILNPILVAIFYHETIGPMSMVGAVIVLASATVYNVVSIKTAE